MSLLRFLVLPLRAPLLLVLFGVAIFLGHHWSIESEHLIALSREDLVELGRFLKPFVDEAENNGT